MLLLVTFAFALAVVGVASTISTEPPQVRELAQLEPRFRAAVESFLAEASAKGTKLKVLETKRSAERQAWLFAQGRTRPGKIVTWTMASRHLTGEAVDVWPSGLGFSSKTDLDSAVSILTGLRPLANKWGLDNSIPNDSGHFQWKGA